MLQNALYQLCRPIRALHASGALVRLDAGSELRIHQDRHHWTAAPAEHRFTFFYSIVSGGQHYQAFADDLELAVVRVLDATGA
jgi:hypothetical protein